MDHQELVTRFASAPFAVLGTHGPDERLDLVPCCFALLPAAEREAGTATIRWW